MSSSSIADSGTVWLDTYIKIIVICRDIHRTSRKLQQLTWKKYYQNFYFVHLSTSKHSFPLKFVGDCKQKKKIWLGRMAKSTMSTENSRKQSDKNANKMFSNSMNTEWIRTVSWSNKNHSPRLEYKYALLYYRWQQQSWIRYPVTYVSTLIQSTTVTHAGTLCVLHVKPTISEAKARDTTT